MVHRLYHKQQHGQRRRVDPDTRMYFYMPSGEEVSFCAHAAIGACVGVSSESQTSGSPLLREKCTTSVVFERAESGVRCEATVTRTPGDDDDEHVAEILLDAPLEETVLRSFEEESVVCEELLDQLGLEKEDLLTTSGSLSMPLFLNSSVARTKTLIPVSCPEGLHAATNPQNPLKFKELCGSIRSTGAYLYTPIISHVDGNTNVGVRDEPSVFECRQFPRDSGYPEDPATGIAGAALASSLYSRAVPDGTEKGNLTCKHYVFYQGTAMGRRSKINIRLSKSADDTDCDDPNDLIYCSGSVNISSKEELSF